MAQAITPPPPPPPLPPGWRFRPEDHELITYYLMPRVMGRQLPCNIIKNIDLYGPHSTPWLLFDLDDPDSWDVDIKKPTEKSLYVFTPLSKLATDPHNTTMKSRFNINRKAGCGTWAQRTKCDPISDRDGNVIGGKRMLVFEINDVGDQFGVCKGGYFRMHEYSLCGVNENLGSDDGGDDLVLCKITFDSSKKSPLKLATKNSNVSRSGNESRNKKRYKNLQGTLSSTSKSVTAMNSNISREIRSSNSDSLVTVDGGVGKGDLCAAAQYGVGVQDSDECGGGLNFDNLGGGSLYLDDLGDEGFSLDDLGGLDLCLDDLGGEALCLDDLGGSDSLVTVDGGVGKGDLCAAAQYGVGVQDSDECGGGLNFDNLGGGSLYLDDLGDEGFSLDDLGGLDLCLDDLGGEALCLDDLCNEDAFLESFDIDGFMQSMPSNQAEEPLEDKTMGKQGKRKFEGKDSCRAK